MTSLLWIVQPAATAFQTEVGIYEGMEQAIKIGIAALSLILFALSLSAYRRTQLRRLVYAAAAFGLFAVQMVVEYVEDVFGVGAPYASVIAPGFILGILILFFLAIVGGARRSVETADQR